MAITISENPSEERFKSSLANLVEAIEPDIDSLPEPWKDVFNNPMKLLMGSKISLGIIPDRRLWSHFEKISYIVYLLKYPDFINYDLQNIAAELTELFGLVNVGMAHDGKFLLEGPMSRQFVKQTQELVQPATERRRYIR